MASKFVESAINKIKKKASSLGKRVTTYFDPTSNQGNNVWSAKPIQNYAKSGIGNFLQGYGEGAGKYVTPYAKLLGEAAYQGGRKIIDPKFKNQKLPTTLFLKPEQIKDTWSTIKTGTAATTKAMLAVKGFSKPGVAAMGTLLSGGIGYGASRLSGQDKLTAYQEAGRASGYSPVYSGIANSTNPLYEKLGFQILGPAANKLLPKILTKGAINAIGNVAENEMFTPLTELRRPTKQENLVGFGLGFLATAGTETLSYLKNMITRSPKVESQLIDMAGKWVEGKKPVKPPKMPKLQWEFQIKVNNKLGRNPYTPIYPDDLQQAIDLGMSVRVKGGNKAIFDAQTKVDAKAGLYDTNTPLYRGVSKGQTGLEASTDSAHSYGTGVYLVDKPSVAKEYANMKTDGSVVEVRPTKLLNLYTPTEAERLNIVDKYGSAQDSYISKLLGDKYDGLKIVDRNGNNEIIIRNKELLSPTQPKGTPVAPEGRISTPPVESATKIKTQQAISPEVPPVTGGGAGSLPPASIPQTDPIQKVIQALTEAKPLEKQQASIYGKIRSQQAGAVAGVGKNIPGEAGYFAQLSKLKREMPKVQFESIRKQITQPDIDALFNKVEQANITPFEKVTAKTGLAKLMGAEGGQVPVQSELKLLNEIFPPEFMQAVLDKRSTMQKLFTIGEEVLNLPRAMMATADMSAPLRQGVFLIGKPKQWLPAFKDMFKYAFSEKAYQGSLDAMKADPAYLKAREAKLALTDMSPMLLSREEAFMSNLAEKIPGFGKLAKGSNRAYSGFLNKLRFDTFKDLYKSAETQGLISERPQILSDIGSFVNAATGRGNLGELERVAPVLNGAFFSPRLMASRLNLLNPVYYAKLDPFVRKEALKFLLTFAGTGATVLTLAKLGGANVGVDPTSSDFGKMKIGNTRLDIWGGFQQYFRAAGQLITGKYTSSTTGKEYTLGEGYKPLTRLGILGKLIESKESPVLSFASQLLSGQSALGGKLDIPVEVVNRFIPMVAQDMYDLYKEGGLKDVALGIPALFGVGVQTYGRQIPTQETTPAGKPTVKLNPVPGLAEDIMSKIRGKPVSNIPQDQWAGIVTAKAAQQQLDILKDKVKQNPESVDATTLNNNGLYLAEDGSFIDISKVVGMPSGTAYEKALKDSKAYNLVDNILDGGLSADQQQQALQQLGISTEDASYYNIARQNNDLKSVYVTEEIGKIDDRKKMLETLVSYRKEVNGKMILANGVVDDLFDSGVISASEKAMLKNLKIGSNGKVKTKVTGRGKKVTLKKVSYTPKSTKIKSMRSLLSKYKRVKIKERKYKFKSKL